MEKKTLDLRSALLHPLWMGALLILLLNDHIFKFAYSNVLTGKLSDFAGLFIAPVLLGILFNIKKRQTFIFAGLLIGAVFTLLNLFSAFAQKWDAMMSLVYSWKTTPDPTDLIALIVIPMSLYFFSTRSPKKKNYRWIPVFFIGLLASIATSPDPGTNQLQYQSALSIYNQTNELLHVEIQTLKNNISLDCEAIEKDPTQYASPDIFEHSSSFDLQSGQQIPIDKNYTEENFQDCNLALVKNEHLPPLLLFWTKGFEIKSYPFDADIPRDVFPDPQTLVIHADYSLVNADDMHDWRTRTECGSRADICDLDIIKKVKMIPPGTKYHWESDSNLGSFHHAYDESSYNTKQICDIEMPALVWENSKINKADTEYLVKRALFFDTGCHALVFQSDAFESEIFWQVCAPKELLQKLVPTPTHPAVVLSFTQTETTELKSLLVRAIYYEDKEKKHFSSVKSFYFNIAKIPAELEIPMTLVPREMCAPQFESCKGLSIPAAIKINNDTILPGEKTSFGDVIQREIYVIRAEYRPVVDLCLSEEELRFNYTETIVFTE